MSSTPTEPRYLKVSWTYQPAETPFAATIGDVLWVAEGPNQGAKVQVVGFNREAEPICQRLDGAPLEWNGSRRHVLDMPVTALSRKKPVKTLEEAARNFLAAFDKAHYMQTVNVATARLDLDAVLQDASTPGWKPL